MERCCIFATVGQLGYKAIPVDFQDLAAQTVCCVASDVEGMTGWRAKIPSARGNVFSPVSDSRRPWAEFMQGDDELERADSERARKQIRMRKGFPSSRNEKGPGVCAGAFEVEGMTGIEPA